MAAARSAHSGASTRHGRRDAVLSPAWTLLAVPAISLVLAWLFFSPWMPRAALAGLREASAGWLQPTLVCAGLAGIVQLALLFGPARQRGHDVGWRIAALPGALLAGIGLWLLMQAPALLQGPEAWQRAAPWRDGLGVALGPLLAQLAATAWVEETVFRGWLWPQLSARLSAHVMPGAASILAAGVSQAVFALLHLPALLSGDAPVVGTLAVLFATGLVFVALYAATGNLLVAVAVHALGNAPTPLLQPPAGAPAPTMLLLAGTLALVIAAALRRRMRR
jgi:membrane protease YdiL (CAAX protease family)